MIYLALPYSHPDKTVMHERFLAANRQAAKLMQMGLAVFSPISHGHPIAQEGALPTDWQYWKAYCEKMMSICTTVVVLQLDGWDQSVGVKAELEVAERLELPVV